MRGLHAIAVFYNRLSSRMPTGQEAMSLSNKNHQCREKKKRRK